jgi:hypothetical protein
MNNFLLTNSEMIGVFLIVISLFSFAAASFLVWENWKLRQLYRRLSSEHLPQVHSHAGFPVFFVNVCLKKFGDGHVCNRKLGHPGVCIAQGGNSK